MNRTPLEQAFEVCQKSKTAWLNAKAGLAQAEMALRERELTGSPPEPEEIQALRDAADLKKREVSQSAGCYIRDHEAVQRISVRRQLHAFMQKNGTALAVALAPELMHLSELPERVRDAPSTALPPVSAKPYPFIWQAGLTCIMRRTIGIF
ncbi:Phage polarity suppression protein (Psu) [Cedecea sp. NFIX57]|nr:Phage polarity suppression protein (Psu) [Cedecea sp. NFIX57]